MRPGGGKQKGSAFERRVCVDLSLWVTRGKNKDVFWRSSMSGGRATIHVAKGQLNRQAGDICAVAPEGHSLTNNWFIECKHVKNLSIDGFFISNVGPLAKFWKQCMKQAGQHKKEAMLIAKQNNQPTLLIVNADIDNFGFRGWHRSGNRAHVYLYDQLLKLPYRGWDLRQQ